MNAKKMMLVIGGEHNGATVEVEDYGFAIRLPLPFSKDELEQLKGDTEPPQRYSIYYRAGVSLQDDDGSVHQIEFLRHGKLSVKQAVEMRLLPERSPEGVQVTPQKLI